MVFTMRSNLMPLGGLTFSVQLQAIPVIVLGAALLALFVAAGMLILASFARTFREGQSLVSPFMIVFVLPLMFSQSPSQEYTMKVAFIPIVNVAMMFRQAIVGQYEWIPILITIGVELACVVVALKLATTIVEYEDFITIREQFFVDMLLSTSLDRYFAGDGRSVDASKVFLALEPDSAGYVILGPTLRLLEGVHPRLPATFLNLFLGALNRWVRAYDYRDAFERVERLREWYESDPDGEAVELPDIDRCLPKSVKRRPLSRRTLDVMIPAISGH
jgi:hypothetical protein